MLSVQLRARRYRRVVVYGLAGATTFLLSLANPFHVGSQKEARGNYDLGVDYTHSSPALAIEALTRSITADSLYAPAWKVRGEMFSEIGEHEPAVADLTTACDLDPSFTEAFVWLGVANQRQNRHARAFAAYTRALSVDPQNVVSLTNIADIYVRQARYDSAMAYLERALVVAPDFENALFGMGVCNEMTGDYDRALSYYSRVLHMPAARYRVRIVAGKLVDQGSTPELAGCGRAVAGLRS